MGSRVSSARFLDPNDRDRDQTDGQRNASRSGQPGGTGLVSPPEPLSPAFRGRSRSHSQLPQWPSLLQHLVASSGANVLTPVVDVLGTAFELLEAGAAVAFFNDSTSLPLPTEGTSEAEEIVVTSADKRRSAKHGDKVCHTYSRHKMDMRTWAENYRRKTFSSSTQVFSRRSATLDLIPDVQSVVAWQWTSSIMAEARKIINGRNKKTRY
ncbi:hypothetical protein V5799_004173 [Amblyomma americanum]|uniref:Uncharacterized protein n=1 Tax=Amblyomma americanum TaxID=6943 RepID=A0AAQ4D6V5_AMBAM